MYAMVVVAVRCLFTNINNKNFHLASVKKEIVVPTVCDISTFNYYYFFNFASRFLIRYLAFSGKANIIADFCTFSLFTFTNK